MYRTSNYRGHSKLILLLGYGPNLSDIPTNFEYHYPYVMGDWNQNVTRIPCFKCLAAWMSKEHEACVHIIDCCVANRQSPMRLFRTYGINAKRCCSRCVQLNIHDHQQYNIWENHSVFFIDQFNAGPYHFICVILRPVVIGIQFS